MSKSIKQKIAFEAGISESASVSNKGSYVLRETINLSFTGKSGSVLEKKQNNFDPRVR